MFLGRWLYRNSLHSELLSRVCIGEDVIFDGVAQLVGSWCMHAYEVDLFNRLTYQSCETTQALYVAELRCFLCNFWLSSLLYWLVVAAILILSQLAAMVSGVGNVILMHITQHNHDSAPAQKLHESYASLLYMLCRRDLGSSAPDYCINCRKGVQAFNFVDPCHPASTSVHF